MRVKVYGAGSIGNHLSNAARRLGWSVDLCDLDPAALRRTREEIYPGRYGAWDEAIGLHVADTAPQGGYDLICIGTPPPAHLPMAMLAVAEQPRAVLVEKPVCLPDLAGAQGLVDAAAAAGVAMFAGYDHVVGRAGRRVADLLAARTYGDLVTLDVEFREHWGGIFAAHPWLDGPHDSYLGYWQRGGGASGEHSHAANLWQHLAGVAGAGRVAAVQASLDYMRDGRVDYDRLCLLTLTTERGLAGRVVQDVVTQPARKWARAQCVDGYIEWHCGHAPGRDAVIHASAGTAPIVEAIEKTRPDDFIEELRHIADALEGDAAASPLALARGLDTMLVVAAAHRADAEQRAVRIDYAKGYSPTALTVA